MNRLQQPENPAIELIEHPTGETTLYIDGGQAMQGWERDLMWRSADLLCTHGSNFLEAGLGLGLSSLRIASHPNTQRHVVVEKYSRVIELFRERHPNAPEALDIVQGDFFEFVHAIPRNSVDGIFFDPYFGADPGWEDQSLWDRTVPAIRDALRPGGALIPYFSTRPILKWPFIDYFDHVFVEKQRYVTYNNTEYAQGPGGVAYIQCFIKTSE